jgi:hypothetical protein
MQPCFEYLGERGITDDIVKNHGIELDDILTAKTVKERLGCRLPKGVNEVIWIPIYEAKGNVVSWIARILPTIEGFPKFLCPLGSGGPPFVPLGVYDLPYGQPAIISEGPIKAMICFAAGFATIGINGVWGAGVKNSQGLYVIPAILQNVLDWRGRKVYLAFDADYTVNPGVRHAMIRLFFVLSVAGAEVFQLTNWDVTQGKGIDDYLVNQLHTNGQSKAEDVLQRLMSSATPFIDNIKPTSLDLDLVCSELQNVYIPGLLREQFCRPLAQRLGVRIDELRKVGANVNRPADFVDLPPGPNR